VGTFLLNPQNPNLKLCPLKGCALAAILQGHMKRSYEMIGLRLSLSQAAAAIHKYSTTIALERSLRMSYPMLNSEA
jgi:hypothetical protein